MGLDAMHKSLLYLTPLGKEHDCKQEAKCKEQNTFLGGNGLVHNKDASGMLS